MIRSIIEIIIAVLLIIGMFNQRQLVLWEHRLWHRIRPRWRRLKSWALETTPDEPKYKKNEPDVVAATIEPGTNNITKSIAQSKEDVN